MLNVIGPLFFEPTTNLLQKPKPTRDRIVGRLQPVVTLLG